MPFSYMNHSSRCREIQNASWGIRTPVGIEPSIEMYEAIIIMLVTGFLALMVAVLFTAIRKHVYKDQDDQVDTSFDAGGKVNAGLTATTIVSQWTWAATLLQSSTVAAKYGISGSFWYAAGATVQIMLFSMLAVQLKTRAPGAKTFLQVIKARFGRRSHIVFCCYALTTNIVVTAMLMLGGSAVIKALVKVISVEYATTLVAAIIGGYTFIGGLGATFYVSYFTTVMLYVIILIFIFNVYEDYGDSSNVLGSADKLFDFISCAKGPDGNKGNSYLTLVSDQGLMFGLINLVGNFGAVFVDQSYWQSAVAAKPKQGVIGFLLGGFAWFAIPFSFSTAMGLGYVALCAEQGQGLLSDAEVNEGLVAPLVAHRLLGKTGELLILSMVLLAVTSTASAEVMAVASIIIYDMYAQYLKPYRLTTDTNSCILCGRGRGRLANPRDKCVCISMTFCTSCHQDTKARNECLRAIKPDYRCPCHGSYRVYNDYLGHLTRWTVIWTTMAVIPFTIILYTIQASLGWVYLFMGILNGSAVIPITLTMFWERLTCEGMISGTIGGTIIALCVWLGVASTYEGGLSDWWNSTGQELAMLSGNLAAILAGGLITVVVSLVRNIRFDPSTGVEIWETTRDIDNPLSPWMEKYQRKLNLYGSHRLENRPSLQEVQKAFKGAKNMAYFMSTIVSGCLVILWPAAMVATGVMSRTEFHGWVKLSEVWAFLSMFAMTVLPLVNEIWDVWAHYTAKQKVRIL
ncbi:unnamed protein product [Candidula unifasciata]|uniref:Urea-proton symporter DUR3 n=1 Tax=Candidula unifasciata TaxID=100452 RepID=A0A8S3ZPR5_9EUPU|nr:unnamed protein product [Candidula unifasciata]